MRLGQGQEAGAAVVIEHLGGLALFHNGLGFGGEAHLHGQLGQQGVLVLARDGAGQHLEAIDVQRVMVGHALAALGQLEQVAPIFRLAGVRDQCLQSFALGGIVARVIGAAHQEHLGGVAAGIAQGTLDVADAALLVA